MPKKTCHICKKFKAIKATQDVCDDCLNKIYFNNQELLRKEKGKPVVEVLEKLIG